MRKLKARESTEASLIHLLNKSILTDCKCEIAKLCKNVALLCVCPETEITPPTSDVDDVMVEVSPKSTKRLK